MGFIEPVTEQSLSLVQCNPRVNDPTITVDLDPSTNATFDNAYYKNLLEGRGVLATDEMLAHNNLTVPLVQKMAAVRQASSCLSFMVFGEQLSLVRCFIHLNLSNMRALIGKSAHLRSAFVGTAKVRALFSLLRKGFQERSEDSQVLWKDSHTDCSKKKSLLCTPKSSNDGWTFPLFLSCRGRWLTSPSKKFVPRTAHLFCSCRIRRLSSPTLHTPMSACP